MPIRLIKTDLLFTAIGDPIANGMIKIDENNKITAIGRDIDSKGIEIEYFKGALCPAFINTHCHIELSHLKGKITSKTGLNGFIKELQNVRNASDEEIINAIKEANQEMINNGIIAVGDISNGNSSFSTKVSSPIYYHSFIELFGFNSSMAKAIYERGIELKKKAENLKLVSSIVPHSPYSVSDPLFKLIFSGSESLFSIHNQESASENELYQTGSGSLASMLENFKLDLSQFNISGKNSLPTYLNYYKHNSPLLLVHNTYTSIEDIQYAEKVKSNLYWCFCPNANLYIEGRLPNIYSFVDENVKCTIGTDSLASNHTLSVWEEIKTIKKHFNQINLNTLIKWGTINGAKFLGISNKYGSFEVGKEAKINWISNYEDIEQSFLKPIL